VLVLLHHCLTEYLSTWKPWKARKGDTAHWLLVQLFVNGNQAYFMTLFFFLSGAHASLSVHVWKSNAGALTLLQQQQEQSGRKTDSQRELPAIVDLKVGIYGAG
jgi:hypothetical protein